MIKGVIRRVAKIGWPKLYREMLNTRSLLTSNVDDMIFRISLINSITVFNIISGMKRQLEDLLGEFTMVSQPIKLILIDLFVFHFIHF